MPNSDDAKPKPVLDGRPINRRRFAPGFGGDAPDQAAAPNEAAPLIVEVVVEPDDRAANLDDPGGLYAVSQQLGVVAAEDVFPGDAAEEEAKSLAGEAFEPRPRFLRLSFPPGSSPEAVRAALENVREVREAVIVPGALPPSVIDPLLGAPGAVTTNAAGIQSQWYLHRTNTPAAWATSEGDNVVLADLDWGYRTTHDEFTGAITKTYNAYDGGPLVNYGMDTDHGTAVLGLAGARADTLGMVGYAPKAELWAIQGNGGANAKLFSEPWVEAIDYVRRTPAAGRRKVIILEVQTGSYGNYEQIPSIREAISRAIADNCVVCVAAGNGGARADRTDDGRPFPPTQSILVGATEYDPLVNRRASFSNYGPNVTVCAPGDQTHDVTCSDESDVAFINAFGGTSGATPKVAGTVALMLSVNPRLTHAEVRQILVETGAAPKAEAGKPIGVFLNTAAAVAAAKAAP